MENNTHSVAPEKINSSFEIERIVNEIIGVSTDSTNRIGEKHLRQVIQHTCLKAPVKKGTLVSQLRLKLLISERYILEYLHGLEAFEIIRTEDGMVYWNYNGNKGNNHDNYKNSLSEECKTDKA